MNTRRERKEGWNRLKIFLGLATLVFVMTLAVVVGNRLSDEALAVLAGAVCGVGAAIPTSLLIIAVSRRRDEHQVQEVSPHYRQERPPVVVVAPHNGSQRANSWNAFPPSLTAPMQRDFTVVGGPSTNERRSYERHS